MFVICTKVRVSLVLEKTPTTLSDLDHGKAISYVVTVVSIPEHLLTAIFARRMSSAVGVYEWRSSCSHHILLHLMHVKSTQIPRDLRHPRRIPLAVEIDRRPMYISQRSRSVFCGRKYVAVCTACVSTAKGALPDMSQSMYHPRDRVE